LGSNLLMDSNISISLPALRELSAPRHARFTESTRKSRLVMINVWIITLIFFLFLAVRDIGHVQQLATRGKIAPARMTEKHISRGKSTSHIIRYWFTAENQAFNNSFHVSPSTYASYTQDTPIWVTYLPGDPSTYEPFNVDARNVEQHTTNWTIGIVIGAGLLGLCFLGVVGIQNDHLRYLRDGILVEAEITGRDAVVTKTITYFVLYRFTAGASQLTKRVTVTKMLYDAAETETKLPVLYLPQTPERSMPVANLDGVML
jgi:hypothetical protein